jgi:hypothetical protein
MKGFHRAEITEGTWAFTVQYMDYHMAWHMRPEEIYRQIDIGAKAELPSLVLRLECYDSEYLEEDH